MAGVDTSTFENVLKVVYGPGIAELIDTKTRALDMFQEGDGADWRGKYVEYPVVVGRSEGAGWAVEGGQLPTAGAEKTTPQRINVKYMYGRITLSAQVLKAAEGNRASFASAMDREMKGVIKTMAAERGRAILHDGRGVLCLVNGTATSTTQTLDAPGGVTGATNGARFLRPGMIVATVNATTGALVASTTAKVVSVSSDGTQVTLDTSVTWTDNNFVVKALTSSPSDVTNTGFQKEIMGLLGLIDDGTYVSTLHNVNRTLYPLFSSKVITSVGALSSDVLQRGIDVADEIGSGEISDLMMHHSVRRAYIAMTDADRRYQGADLSRPDEIGRAHV